MSPLPPSPDKQMNASPLKTIYMITDVKTMITFPDVSYEIMRNDNRIRIIKDKNNHVDVTLVNQQVSYKATILGGFAQAEEKKGQTRYNRYFYIDWEDDLSIPVINFRINPIEVAREYIKGQWIELGIENVSRYVVKYHDGVDAVFQRNEKNGFSFNFSTGFYGSFWSEDDGSYMLKFKGDKLKPGEDDLKSQSKFIVSRSKYTDKLLLFLKENATVLLK